MNKSVVIGIAVSAGIIVASLVATRKYLDYVSFFKGARSAPRTYVGGINRAQQAFRLEKDKFAESLTELGIGISSENNTFNVSTKLLSPNRVQSFVTPKIDGISAAVGGVIYTKVKGEDTSLQTICSSDQPTKTAPPEMIFSEGEAPKCPEGYHKET